jgi:ubiquinone/menaquinone biosynthesis C-methylase UbiE/DNA-binding transcriptional ArsR family regulator
MITVVDRLQALADATRTRLLHVLERQELTVGDLCDVLQLPQSTVSRHLKVLGEDGWVVSRADGTSNWYRMAVPDLEPGARKLWQAVRDQVAAAPAAARDLERLRGVLARRRAQSDEFFATAAGQWDRMRAELFGARVELLPLLGLLETAWTVGDLGCGTGQLVQAVAPFAGRVIGVDGSAAMLRGAKARLADLPNVELRRGDLESLPLDDGALDLALIVLVLPYVADPARVIAEAARTLRPGGRLLLTDMLPHDRAEYRQTMGHLWQGFAQDQVLGWLAAAGLAEGRYGPVPLDPSARGPMLFLATGRRT